MKKRLFTIMLTMILIMLGVFALSACEKAEELLNNPPENIRYDGTYITWDKVANANHYNIVINGGTPARSNSTTYQYISNKTFDVTVTAVFDRAEIPAAVTFKPLQKITDISVTADGVLDWGAISGANSYKISVNGKETTTTNINYTELTAGSNRVKVMPAVTGDSTYYSFWSDEITVVIYDAPSSVTYDGAYITWTGDSANYEVTVNGKAEAVKGNKMSYNSGNKDFTVQIKAVGDHSVTFDSKQISEDFHYLNAVTNLVAEDGVVKWNPVDGAEKYKIMIDGIIQRDAVTDSEYTALITGKSQDVAVMPVNESGNYFSTWSAEKTFYILQTPSAEWNNALELDGEANRNFFWDAVNSAEGYVVRLTKNGELVDNYEYSAMQRDFPYAFAETGIYTVEVKAKASKTGADYYDSRYSAALTIERIAAPQAAKDNFIVSDKDKLTEGFVVNFIKVSGASGYQMYKDGALMQGKYTDSAALADNNVADLSNIGEQNYTYTVRSMGGVKTDSGKKYVTLPCLTADALSFNITVQATVKKPQFSGYVLSWEAIAGNNGYAVSYAGSSVTAQTENVVMSTVKAGAYSVTVCARGNGSNVLASNYSAPESFTRLQAPTDIAIDATNNGTLQWKEVSYATGYQAFLDLSETALSETAYENMYQFITTQGTALSMVAAANYYNADETTYYMSSETSPTQQFVRLAAPVFPEGAVKNSIELLWNTPDNINTAEYTPTYNIYSAIGEQIGGGSLNGTKYNIEHIEGGKSHTFYVKAIGNDVKYLDSAYSPVIEVFKLAAPKFTIGGGAYQWSNVANASSYYMEIDGAKVMDGIHVSGSSYSYTPKYTSAGDHIVKLKAVGDGRDTVDSAEYMYVQKSDVLQSPKIKYYYSSDSVVTGGSITVEITLPTANCLKYNYEIAGETVTSGELSYSKVINSAGSYSVRVKALGGAFDDSGVYYIDSKYAGGSATDVITLLGAPSEASFTINTDGVIKWSSVSGCYGYDYLISFDGVEFTEAAHTAYNSLDPVSGHKQYRTITVRVRATGSADGKTVASKWTEWTWTNADYTG